MPHERFFIEEPLIAGETVSLQDGEFHHLCHVMRARIGEHVELVNGKNQLAQASLSHIARHHADLAISTVYTEPKVKPRIVLAQATPRFNRLEYILEKATELDVTAIWLFPGMLSEKEKFSENQHKRMAQMKIAAMKQCGRLDLPEIVFKPPLLEWKPLEGQALFGDTAPDAPALWEVADLRPPLTFFVGPEKGFDPKEEVFLKQSLSARGVKLHSNVLRVDTAPLVALSLIHAITRK